MTTRANFSKYAVADIGFGDSTTTFTQTSRWQTDGTKADNAAAQYIDSAVIPLSSAAKTLLSLTGTKYLDDGLTASVVGMATIAVAGKTTLSAAPLVAGTPIAVGTEDAAYKRILSAAITAGITGAVDAVTASNPVVTAETVKIYDLLGTGRDGHGRVGTLAKPATPSLTVTDSGGSLVGICSYKICCANLSGQSPISDAPASTASLTVGTVVVNCGALPANGTHWEIYRDIAATGTWSYIGKTTGTTYTDTSMVKDTSRTSAMIPIVAASTTASISGEYDLSGLTLASGDTITVPNSGAEAGVLILRNNGATSFASGATITASTVALDFTESVTTAYRQARYRSAPTAGAAGSIGYGGTAGAAGAAAATYGGLVVIASRTWTSTGGTITASSTATGSAGGVGSGTPGGGGGGGGGGGAGGSVILLSTVPQDFTGTITCAGSAGGAGGAGGPLGTDPGMGGGGGAGGSGGTVILLGPNWSVSGTITFPGGSGGAAGAAGGSNTGASGNSGGNGGTGGGSGATAVTGGAGGSDAPSQVAAVAGTAGTIGQLIKSSQPFWTTSLPYLRKAIG